jgi:hypothetical protein
VNFSVDDGIVHSVKFPNNALRLRYDSRRQPDKLSDIGLCIPHSFDLASVIRPDVAATFATVFHRWLNAELMQLDEAAAAFYVALSPFFIFRAGRRPATVVKGS